jgi:hypothetical protein
MGFTSQDDLLAKITAGQYLRRESSKIITPAGTAGGWHCLAGAAGYPNASTFPATADLVWSATDELSGDGTTLLGIHNGGGVAAATKHIINVGINLVAAAGAPWQAKLVDLQGYYRLSGANVTGTGSRVLVNSQTFTASSSTGLLLSYANDFKSGTKVRFTNAGGALPVGISAGVDYWLVRQGATTAKVATSFANYIAGSVVAYTDGGSGTHTMMAYPARYTNGVGLEAFFVVQTQPTLGGPNLTASAYDNTTDTPGAGTRAFQGSPSFGATADAYALRIPNSGNAAGRYGPFLPKQGGDLGIARINSYTTSAGTAYTGSGVLALCLARPLLDLSIPVTGMLSERDYVNQLPSLPAVEDGACLVWLLFNTGATTNNSPFNSSIDFAWGP